MAQPFALIIEDDPRLATIFSEALRMAEFETETVRDGPTALARLNVTTPAVVLLDLRLPHASSKGILQQIRADERLTKTRIMLATADPIVAETMQAQADFVLIKPISLSQLRDLAELLRSL